MLAPAVVSAHFLAMFIRWPQFYPLEMQDIHVIIVKTKKDLKIFQIHDRTPAGSSLGRSRDTAPELQ